ncbi:HNH endonuclease [Roseinatronobacter ekhonensis]
MDEVVRHRCHNRRCINPEHLTLGSKADNKRDDWDYSANGVDFWIL